MACISLLEGFLSDQEREQEATRRKLGWLEDNHSRLDDRVVRLEQSRIFRTLRLAGGLAHEWKGRAARWLHRSLLHGKVARASETDQQYALWIEREQASTPPAEWHCRRAHEFVRRPAFSILMAVRDPQRERLSAAVRSVLEQTYPWLELCICDNGSSEPWVAEYLTAVAAVDSRVRFLRKPQGLGNSAALNSAGELATGEYVGFLEQDDLLSPYALHYIAEALQECAVDLLYSDEDLIGSSGRRARPVFKPAWSPDLLTGCMYVGRVLVVSRQAIDRAGWFRSRFDLGHDYDLALRIAEQDPVVRHVPRILYHARQSEASTSTNRDAASQSHAAGMEALREAVVRRGIAASVVDGPLPSTYRLLREVQAELLVSIVVCSRSPRLLERCARAIARRTHYSPWEMVVVQHGSGPWPRVEDLLRGARCVALPYTGVFNFARMNNQAARAAAGKVLVFLNDDVEPMTQGWLAALAAQVQRPEVGIAGARLLYPSGAVQHEGIAIGIMDGTGHPGRGCFDGAHWYWGNLTRNVSAVTGACLAIRKQVFEELGGFDEQFPVNYSDVDLCLRAREARYEVICEAPAVLCHREARSRLAVTRHGERERFHYRWSARLKKGDPYYNTNLTAIREDASLRLED